MIIEHQESKKLIEDTFKNFGKVAKYHINIDESQLYSAWTPIKEEIDAFQVFDATGKECFLYYDEMDNYFRMVLVHKDAVLEKEHLSDLVRGVDLPEVGHIYQRDREQEALRKEQAERRRSHHATAVENAMAYFRQMWDERVAINLKFGNIYDIEDDRENHARIMTDKLVGENGTYFKAPEEGQDVLPMTTALREYEGLAGYPFVPSLDDEDGPQKRLLSLSKQLRESIFLAKHGFKPSVKENKDFDSETEAMLTFTLSNARNEPLLDINVLFPESSVFYDCMEEPTIVEIHDYSTDEFLEYEEEVSEHPIFDAFMGYVSNHYDNIQWVIPDGEPCPIKPQGLVMNMDEDFVDYKPFDEALDSADMLRSMDETSGLDEAVQQVASRMEKKLSEEVSFSP